MKHLSVKADAEDMEQVAVRLAGGLGVVVGSLLDLILAHRRVDLSIVVIDSLGDSRGDQALLAEDPEPDVNLQALATGLLRGLIDLADAAVDRLDIERSR